MTLHHIIKRITGLRALAATAIAATTACVVASCASMGRPEGGPRDTTPPVFTAAQPAQGATGVKATRFRLRFDENVELKEMQQKVIVSPSQKRQPAITANGHVITIELRDSLRDSTTYTIDFGDAIADLNEGNLLDGFSYAFSTGPTIDTLAIAGMVFEASNLEPAQGMLVGAYPSSAPDSAIMTLPLERVTRTNQYGQFTLRNLAPGSYRLYALKDVNGDYHWDRSEDIAFLGYDVTPTAEPTTYTDTIAASDGSDSTVVRPSTRFLPDDIILTWFNEGYKPSYLASYARTDTNRLSLIFNAPMDSLPEVRIVAPQGTMARFDGLDASQWGAIDIAPHNDTLDIWIADRDVVRADSLMVSARYMMTDTASRLVWTTDTLKMFVRKGSQKKKADNGASWQARRRSGGKGAKAAALDSGAVAAPRMAITLAGNNTQQLNKQLRLTADRPIAVIDTMATRLMLRAPGDSVWSAVPGFHLSKPEGSRLLDIFTSHVDWVPGADYRLIVDSAAMTSIYGEPLDSFAADFKTRERDEYSSVIFNISGTDGRPAMAQLLNKSDAPVATVAVSPQGRAVFEYLEPDTYYARLFFDANGNGRYDTGNLADSIQPEEVVYFPKRIPLKKNWDLEQSWNIYEMPLDQQKHSEIKKNKPKTKDGEEKSDSDDEDGEMQYDEFGRPLNNQYRNPFGSSSGNGGRGSSGRGGGSLGGRGLMQNTRR